MLADWRLKIDQTAWHHAEAWVMQLGDPPSWYCCRFNEHDEVVEMNLHSNNLNGTLSILVIHGTGYLIFVAR